MRRWQLIVIVLMLGAAAWAVISFPPHTITVTPAPMTNATPTATTSTADSPVILLFVGDSMLSRSVGALMSAKNDWLWPYRKAAGRLAAADLTFGNLETAISTRGAKGSCGFCFRSDPRAMDGLRYAGFDVMSVANNHIWDYGPQAFGDTLNNLASAGIAFVGGGFNEAQARGGVIRNVRGTRVGYLAYTDILPASAMAGPAKPGVALWSMDNMRQDIATLRPKVDILIVSFHTGDEYQLTHNAKQQRIYQAAIDDGADMVIGHHPHVVQELVPYKNGWIAYSLGNFVFDQNFSSETMHGLAVTAEIRGRKIYKVQSAPMDISAQYQSSFEAAQ